MSVTCTGGNRALLVHILGEVDHHGAKEMMGQIGREIDRALPREVTIDLSGVTFMDSSGIAVLLRTQRWAVTTGGSVTVRGTPPQPMRVLRTAGLERILHFE